MSRHVALLRGINVGATKRIAMPPLVAMMEELGFAAVRAYIQSGNLVFEASDPTDLEGRIRAGIAARFGFDVPVVVRSGAELTAVYEGNPWPEVETGRVFVGFFHPSPTVERVAKLDPDRSPGDRFLVRGGEVWMDLGTSAHATRLQAAWFEKQLGVAVTFRNWNTVAKLREMVEEGGG